MRFGLFVVQTFAGLAPAIMNNVRALSTIGAAILACFGETRAERPGIPGGFTPPPASPERRQRVSTNTTETGWPTAIDLPVGVSLPLLGSMRKTTTESEL